MLRRVADLMGSCVRALNSTLIGVQFLKTATKDSRRS
jgi:hypothetical protein